MRARIGTNFTSHSIKKGALVHLLQQGHSLTSVSYKAKHRSVELLRVYIGPQAWAEAHNAHQMADDLRGTIA
jgi:hypothetical protein